MNLKELQSFKIIRITTSLIILEMRGMCCYSQDIEDGIHHIWEIEVKPPQVNKSVFSTQPSKGVFLRLSLLTYV